MNSRVNIPDDHTSANKAATSDAAPLRARLELEDGQTFDGTSFGHPESTAGEVVFTTGMVGYPETLTDPSFCGQVIVCTYPHIGNYGVPAATTGLDGCFESERIHARAILVVDYTSAYSHWQARRTLASWLVDQRVVGITGIDTRALTKRLRSEGSMLGRILVGADVESGAGAEVGWYDPNSQPLGPLVSVREPVLYGQGNTRGRIALVDCGVKHNIIRCLVARGLEVLRVPWDYPVSEQISGDRLTGVMLGNGPGDPVHFGKTVEQVCRLIDAGVPTMGVCLGNQMLALSIGAKTYKLPYGHRGQNQPVIEVGTDRCFITSQNHGFAVDSTTLPKRWASWFENLNDRTNEGIRHESGRFCSVQFHPEAAPGPVDTEFLFDEFVAMVEAATA